MVSFESPESEAKEADKLDNQPGELASNKISEKASRHTDSEQVGADSDNDRGNTIRTPSPRTHWKYEMQSKTNKLYLLGGEGKIP